jgi:hypothetical protein
MRGIAKVVGAAAAILLVAAPVVAQQGPVRQQRPGMGRGMVAGGPGTMGRNPVSVVLDHAEELELTAEQVETLNGLQARLEEENGPRWAELEAAFGDTDPAELSVEEQHEIQERMQALAPVREEIRAANRAAMAEVHELLDDGQEAALRSVMPRRPGGRAGPGPRAGRASDGTVGAAWRSGFRDGWHRGFRAGRGAARPDG